MEVALIGKFRTYCTCVLHINSKFNLLCVTDNYRISLKLASNLPL